MVQMKRLILVSLAIAMMVAMTSPVYAEENKTDNNMVTSNVSPRSVTYVKLPSSYIGRAQKEEYSIEYDYSINKYVLTGYFRKATSTTHTTNVVLVNTRYGVTADDLNNHDGLKYSNATIYRSQISRPNNIGYYQYTIDTSQIPAGTYSIFLDKYKGDGESSWQDYRQVQLRDGGNPDIANPSASHTVNKFTKLFTVSATDIDSGIDYLMIDGTKYTSSPQTLQAPNPLKDIQYYAVDKAGNRSASKTIFKSEWDSTPPTLTVTQQGNTSDWSNPTKGFTYTISAFDSETGIAKIEYQTDKSTNQWNDITNTKQFTIKENCKVTVKATDGAGNSATKQITITKIDGDTPQISTVVSDDGKQIAITATDPTSGISKISVNKQDFTQASTTYNIPPDYDWTTPITITATDLGGNVSTPKIFDKEIPPVKPVPTPPDADNQFVSKFPYNLDIDTGYPDKDIVAKVEIKANGSASWDDQTSNYQTNAPYVKDYQITQECEITVKVTDIWGREQETTFPSAKEDTIPPTLKAIPSDDGSSIHVTVEDTMPGSGIDYTLINGERKTEAAFTYQIPADYNWGTPLEVQAFDKAGNASNKVEFTEKIPPVVKPDISNGDDNGFVSQYPATVDIKVDTPDPSIVAKVEVAIDTEPYQDYTSNWQKNIPYVKGIVIQKQCTLHVKVTDKWGREQSLDVETGKLDDTKPSFDYEISQDKTEITITGKDPDGSGVDKIIINGQEYFDNPVTVPIVKDQDIVVQIVDKVGNVSDEVTLSYDTVLDGILPDVSLTLPPDFVKDGVPTEVPVVATDNIGIQKVEYKLPEDSDWIDITAERKLIVSTNGSVIVKATDLAGNFTEKTFQIEFFDGTPPKAEVEVDKDGSFIIIDGKSDKSEIDKITINGQDYKGRPILYLIAEGTDITITVTDKIGNTSDEIILDYDKDIKPPVPDNDNSGNSGDGSDSNHENNEHKHSKSYDSWNKSYQFWWEQEQKIRKLSANSDLLIRANGRIWMPGSTMELLYSERPDVRLIIKWNGGSFIIEPGEALKPELGRIHYLLEKLEEEYHNNETKE